jgi:homoserine kinase type II
MVSFLDGAWLRKPKAIHCREVGRAHGRNACGRQPVFRSGAKTRSPWATGVPLWDGSRARADEVQPGLRDEIDQALSELETQAGPQGLPEGVIHADLFPDNVFFIEDRLSGPDRLLFRLQ